MKVSPAKTAIMLLCCCLIFQQNIVASPMISYDGAISNISAAVKKANEVLSSPKFYSEIRKIKSFDNTKLTGNEIADLMEKANQKISIRTYWYWNPFHPKNCVNANTQTSTRISINKRCFSDVLSVAVNTLIHETIHAVDWLDGTQTFTHDGNSSEGQENTAPWVIGAIAERLIEENQ